jgi:chemotaxis protein methyltransferase CheR
MIKIKPDEIPVLAKFIYNISGIVLDESKAYLMETR